MKIGDETFTVRKARVPVTKENYKVLQFLDLLKDIDEYADEDENMIRDQLYEYIKRNEICREQVDRYLTYFPLKIYKSIYEMRLEYVFA